MTRAALAKILRRRLARVTDARDHARLNAMPDHELIHAYSKCALCKARLFVNETAAVANSSTPEEFIELCNLALASHACPSQN